MGLQRQWDGKEKRSAVGWVEPVSQAEMLQKVVLCSSERVVP